MNNKDFPNMPTIRGLIATSVGLLCIIFAYKILIAMVLFLCGLTLIYYGLQQLNISSINAMAAALTSWIKKLFS